VSSYHKKLQKKELEIKAQIIKANYLLHFLLSGASWSGQSLAVYNRFATLCHRTIFSLVFQQFKLIAR